MQGQQCARLKTLLILVAMQQAAATHAFMTFTTVQFRTHQRDDLAPSCSTVLYIPAHAGSAYPRHTHYSVDYSQQIAYLLTVFLWLQLRFISLTLSP